MQVTNSKNWYAESTRREGVLEQSDAGVIGGASKKFSVWLFAIFSCNLLACIHAATSLINAVRSSWSSAISDGAYDPHRFVYYLRTCVVVDHVAEWVVSDQTCSRNRIGPRTYPCGTPHKTMVVILTTCNGRVECDQSSLKKIIWGNCHPHHRTAQDNEVCDDPQCQMLPIDPKTRVQTSHRNPSPTGCQKLLVVSTGLMLTRIASEFQRCFKCYIFLTPSCKTSDCALISSFAIYLSSQGLYF